MTVMYMPEQRLQMYLPFKYRLYPFRNQERELLRQLDELKFLHNYALEQRIDSWRLQKKSVSYTDQQASLTRWRHNDMDGLGRVYIHVAQDCLHRLDNAFKSFFRQITDYPRFKHEITSLTYPDAYNGSVAITEGRRDTKRLHLSKIGDVPIKYDRPLPAGRIKTCTVKREGDRWYAVLTIEVADAPVHAVTEPVNPVGIDLGLNHIATLSTGETVEPPKFFRRSERSLRRAQQKLSREIKGSNNWKKQKIRVARCYAKVKDKRMDFAHKLTTGWAKQHDLIAFEDMDVRNMVHGHFAKSISDAGWGMFRQMCSYKAPRSNGMYIEVQTINTTQECSKCGRTADPPLELEDRVYRCPCGHTEDRDVNASRNILGRALAAVGQGMPEFTRVETGPPPSRSGRRVRSSNRKPPAAKGVTF
ncbi:MAG: transposase [Thermoplasmata archaeon YP2-bin.285]|uniref:Transposase n=1 Tax=Candidatus Sysuiplasma superficiale TaxID=2823368 RepID=A0A8J7YL96_9ARCH|nr:transposase [Candidatus Sysuiplasma superficiale]